MLDLLADPTTWASITLMVMPATEAAICRSKPPSRRRIILWASWWLSRRLRGC